MTALHTIKDLMHKAICLLEASYFSERPDRFHPSASSIASPYLLALQRRELITLCKSPEKTSALLLANVVTQLALEKRTPTLLVTGKHSLTILAVNLLLWRAGINLEEAVNPLWDENEFARLTVAAGELASAPLLVTRTMFFLPFKNAAHAAVANHRIRLVVMDRAEIESFGQLSKLSCELGVPITITSSASVGCWRRASEKRSGRNGVE
jgi:replicative DNA helicase